MNVHLEECLRLAEAHTAAQLSGPLLTALREVDNLDAEQRRVFRLALAVHLPTLKSAPGAGAIAVWMGSRVEQGDPPTETVDALLSTMLKWSKMVRGEETNYHRPGSAAAKGTVQLGQGLVAHLVRLSDEQREQVRQNVELIDELSRTESFCAGALWVLEMLRKESGELVVLHMKSRAGFRIAYTNLSTCAHLFSLLQRTLAPLVPEGAQLDGAVDAKLDDADDFVDVAWWHYAQPGPDAGIAAMIPIDALPSDIGRVDGTQVLLLWPTLLGQRSWDSGLFGVPIDAAPGRVRLIAHLDEGEFQRWADRVQAATLS